MADLNERVDFFGIAEDKLIYDESKKRFVHTKDLPGFMTREYMNGSFKSVSKATIDASSLDQTWLDKRNGISNGNFVSVSN